MDVIKVINSKALEYFLIPAEEGFFFDHKETINIDLLNDKNCLFVFATNSNIEFGGIPIQTIIKKYHYNKAISIDYDDYVSYIGGYYDNTDVFAKLKAITKVQ